MKCLKNVKQNNNIVESLDTVARNSFEKCQIDDFLEHVYIFNPRMSQEYNLIEFVLTNLIFVHFKTFVGIFIQD